MSIDAVGGASPGAATPPAATPSRPPSDGQFAATLQRQLDAPRRDIAGVRSEIAAIRAGAPFWQGAATTPLPISRGRQAASDLGGLGGLAIPDLSTSASASGGPMVTPQWLQAQLLPQATGSSADPYGWRSMSRTIGEQVIGPGYGGLFERQINQESGFSPDIVYGSRVSSAGAQGIAQLMPQYYPHVDRLDPRSALMAGAQTMRENLAATGGDVRKALAAYNCGLGRVQQLTAAYGANWEAGLPAETKSYLAAILGPVAPRFQPVAARPAATQPAAANTATAATIEAPPTPTPTPTPTPAAPAQPVLVAPVATPAVQIPAPTPPTADGDSTSSTATG